MHISRYLFLGEAQDIDMVRGSRSAIVKAVGGACKENERRVLLSKQPGIHYHFCLMLCHKKDFNKGCIYCLIVPFNAEANENCLNPCKV